MNIYFRVFIYCFFLISILINNINASEKSIFSNQSEDKNVVICLTGDMMAGERIPPFIEKYGILYPFKHILNIIKESDISFCNLEAPFFDLDEAPKFEKEYNFKVHSKLIKILTEPGFDVVSLANNHIMDFGEGGLFLTIKTLINNGICYCGAGKDTEEASRPAIIEKKGTKVAFLGYSMTYPKEFYAGKDTPGSVYPDTLELKKIIKDVSLISDFIIVSFHWGGEGEKFPKEYQRIFAHFVVNCGADIVVGHHPHVIQSIEIYKNGLIFYSLGNFLFGSYGKHSKTGIIVKTEINKNIVKDAQIIPINVDNVVTQFQPTILKNEEFEKIIHEINDISMELNGNKNVIYKNGKIILNNLMIYN